MYALGIIRLQKKEKKLKKKRYFGETKVFWQKEEIFSSFNKDILSFKKKREKERVF